MACVLGGKLGNAVPLRVPEVGVHHHDPVEHAGASRGSGRDLQRGLGVTACAGIHQHDVVVDQIRRWPSRR
jgi:hypothetical protein